MYYLKIPQLQAAAQIKNPQPMAPAGRVARRSAEQKGGLHSNGGIKRRVTSARRTVLRGRLLWYTAAIRDAAPPAY